jgi:putative hemolysin
LIFPAGKVGGLTKGMVSDFPWRWGIADIVKKDACHVVPVFVDSRNSFTFYMIRKIFPKLNMLFLLRVLKNRKQDLLDVYVGKPINAQSYAGLTSKELINAVRHVTYKLKTEDHGNK